jgi:hypothetical protein
VGHAQSNGRHFSSQVAVEVGQEQPTNKKIVYHTFSNKASEILEIDVLGLLFPIDTSSAKIHANNFAPNIMTCSAGAKQSPLIWDLTIDKWMPCSSSAYRLKLTAELAILVKTLFCIDLLILPCQGNFPTRRSPLQFDPSTFGRSCGLTIPEVFSRGLRISEPFVVFG